MTFLARGRGAPQYPTAPLPGARMIYEADAGINVGAGSPVPTWQDGSGNGLTLAPIGTGATAPTFRVDDDLLPYVAFNGVTNNLGREDAAYLGTVLTLYAVMRPFIVGVGTGNPGYVMLGRLNQDSGGGTGTFSLRRDPAIRHVNWQRDGTLYAATGLPTGAFGGTGASMWGVYAAAFRVVSLDVAEWVAGLNGAFAGLGFGAPGTPLVPFNVTRFALGNRYVGFVADVPPGAATDFGRVDFRAFALYQAQHNDEQMKTMKRYLAHKWKVPVLD